MPDPTPQNLDSQPGGEPGTTVVPRFEAHFTGSLRADPETGCGSRQVRGAHYSWVTPSRVRQPQMLAWTGDLATSLGLEGLDQHAALWTGQRVAPGMQPYAMAYGGHQFGHWAGQLGDGRAINLGEKTDRNGVRQTLQLKGAGPTPYSRSGDGWAVLRSSVREFLCSEAMFHLGVPTTRALSLALTGDQILRDMFYDGRPEYELGATVCRVAPSFVRFGNFELFAAREELDLQRELADYVLREHFGHLVNGAIDAATYLAWFREVCERTADMIVHWSRVGFVHGVMNTDNLSILGLTIDYGPYGWLEGYDPGWTPNTTDAQGKRYAFGEQSNIGLWNLLKLANAILPLIQDVEALQEALGSYAERYDRGWERMMANKLGWKEWREDSDSPLVTELMELLAMVETDWTIFFRTLSPMSVDLAGSGESNATSQAIEAAEKRWDAALYDAHDSAPPVPKDYRKRRANWLRRYAQRCAQDEYTTEQSQACMARTNPKYVLRNYLAQLAIEDATRGDLERLQTLQRVLQTPYDEVPGHEDLAAKRPEWARTKPGCSMLSCSS